MYFFSSNCTKALLHLSARDEVVSGCGGIISLPKFVGARNLSRAAERRWWTVIGTLGSRSIIPTTMAAAARRRGAADSHRHRRKNLASDCQCEYLPHSPYDTVYMLLKLGKAVAHTLLSGG